MSVIHFDTNNKIVLVLMCQTAHLIIFIYIFIVELDFRIALKHTHTNTVQNCNLQVQRFSDISIATNNQLCLKHCVFFFVIIY